MSAGSHDRDRDSDDERTQHMSSLVASCLGVLRVLGVLGVLKVLKVLKVIRRAASRQMARPQLARVRFRRAAIPSQLCEAEVLRSYCVGADLRAKRQNPPVLGHFPLNPGGESAILRELLARHKPSI
jgi:hypothetical protein